MRLLREPLLHFLLLGVAIFAAFRWTSGTGRAQPQEIVVSQGRIENLATTFTRTWQRAPSRAELDALIQEYVREEASAREAMALGLDRDDTIIRRRLRQKLEFVSEELAAQAEPTDDELEAYRIAHVGAFAREPRFAFRQVYFDPQRHGANLERDAGLVLAELRRMGEAAEPAFPGDSLLLPRALEAASLSEVRSTFGEKFAARLSALEPGTWQGPLESSYGVHLVLVRERVDGQVPALAEVRDAVRREWERERRLEAQETFYRALLERYRVTIEQQPVSETAAASQAR